LFIATLGPATSPATSNAMRITAAQRLAPIKLKKTRLGRSFGISSSRLTNSTRSQKVALPNRSLLITTRDQQWPKLFRTPPVGRFACGCRQRFNGRMAPRFVTILTGRNLPKIRQSREPEPSTINENTIADFTRVAEQTGILKPWAAAPADDPPADVSA
jgi:hypothetical protein